MSKYRGPRLRIVRRLGSLPGFTRKLSKRNTLPGQAGLVSNNKFSKFFVRLKEKQKLRFNYGITERQLLNYVKKSRKKRGSSGRLLLTFLEMRLDNIVFRLGWAPTVFAARQLINHRHILVNKNIVSIPSFICSPGSIITVRPIISSKKLVERNLMLFNSETLLIPQHLFLFKENLEAKVNNFVNRKSISLVINELLVIEYYSRKL